MSSNLRKISPSGAAYRHPSGAWGRAPVVGEWLPFGTGMNGTVLSLAVYGGNLIAGGSFTTAGGVSCSRIAQWNGSAWSALGSGIVNSFSPSNTTVATLAVYGGELYAGGLFDTAGGSSVSNIARWNGSAWSAVGAGLDAEALGMLVFGGVLFVGGSFTSAGGTGVAFVASWNGSSWSNASSGNAYAPVNAFVSHSSVLHMGAGAGGGGVQTWNGSAWTDIGAISGGGVFDVESFGGNLYAGGNFTDIDSVSVNRLARFNGSTWSAVGNANNIVNALHNWNGEIVLGGEFTNIATRVAKYDGSSFAAFGDGLNGQVVSFATYNGYLVACGQFTASGSETRNRIAYWSLPESP
jgi:hypothetical protein